jgi:branched-chain amino acid transport system substrate-binding protein
MSAGAPRGGHGLESRLVVPLPALRKASPRRATVVVLIAAAAIAAGATGCGSDQSNGGSVKGDSLMIYSSLPLQGPEGERAKSILNAEKLALKDAGGKAGNFKVNFSFVDDSTGSNATAKWNPDLVADNARKAVEDLRTIAYLGELDSEASAVSIPITNEAGFAQVSPGSTAVGLTKLVPGAEKGEPDKFYPTAKRNFARVVPADDVEAPAAAAWARKLGAHGVFVLGDRSAEGDGLAELFRVAAQKHGLEIVGEDRMDPRAKDYSDLAAKIAQAKPDAVFFGGAADSNANALWRALQQAVPKARLIGTHELLSPNFYGDLGASERQTYLTSVAQDPRQLPARGQRFVRDYRREFGSQPDPYAAYGYASMSLLLDAIRRAGGAGRDRERVIQKVFDTKDFDSVVGRFSIDDNGDTNLKQLAGYRIRNGRAVAPTRLVSDSSG